MIKAAVIGNPIKHSRSPLIHNHWLRKSGINGSYEALFAENEAEFINLIKKLRVSGYSGFNITVPFKKIASEIVDERINNETSYCNKDLPAINTIKIENDKLVGYNTDYYAIETRNLEKETIDKIDNIKKLFFIKGANTGIILFKSFHCSPNNGLIHSDYFLSFKTTYTVPAKGIIEIIFPTTTTDFKAADFLTDYTT